ncbi:MAG TPA: phosphoribosylglycinamide formyltransferase [Lachnoclostridium phytofermentans]|uniref:Phosphoribosylglycinamide formyltransferase n=1 Tax=Lachnoclostridium phytofermentans TaxID=66219 RepID=A0A3D2X733_9FIRM|nr:phosphoribosylglycinamide formyltransferase [Lachnoclostridium sp.]HCL02527.1 phosphoribosylglycinamide formyltransferase [Lachnoclostridium phytofermentans]
MLRIVVMVSGGGTNLQAIIDSIRIGRISNAEVVSVISNKKDAYALTRAKNYGIDARSVSPKDFETREEFHEELLNTINGYLPDLIVLAGFLVILPKELVANYPNKIINVHPSLIPSFCGEGYYGLRVHEAVLKRGNKITGATVHFVDEGTDSGPILLQKAVSVLVDDTPEILQKRVMEEAEWIILPQAIDAIANGRVEIKDHIAIVR